MMVNWSRNKMMAANKVKAIKIVTLFKAKKKETTAAQTIEMKTKPLKRDPILRLSR